MLICLLPIWAKISGKIGTRRLINYLKEKRFSNKNECGFRRGVDTIDAINEGKKTIKINIKENNI